MAGAICEKKLFAWVIYCPRMKYLQTKMNHQKRSSVFL